MYIIQNIYYINIYLYKYISDLKRTTHKELKSRKSKMGVIYIYRYIILYIYIYIYIYYIYIYNSENTLGN